MRITKVYKTLENYNDEINARNTRKDIAIFRKALQSKYGKRKYRITAEGDVEVYSQQTNTDVMRWWYASDVAGVKARLSDKR